MPSPNHSPDKGLFAFTLKEKHRHTWKRVTILGVFFIFLNRSIFSQRDAPHLGQTNEPAALHCIWFQGYKETPSWHLPQFVIGGNPGDARSPLPSTHDSLGAVKLFRCQHCYTYHGWFKEDGTDHCHIHPAVERQRLVCSRV